MQRILGGFALLCFLTSSAVFAEVPKPLRKPQIETAKTADKTPEPPVEYDLVPEPQKEDQAAAEDKEEVAATLTEEETEDEKEEKKENPPVSYDLPDYKKNDKRVIGTAFLHEIGEEDTLMDIARYYEMGYVEMKSANPGVDSWTPERGKKILIPQRNLLPRAEHKGLIVNLGEMRLYYFKDDGSVVTYPIGIGREGLQTPLGKTTIIKKLKRPSWYPTERMRKEKPGLPKRVRTGPANPLGDRALYLGWPTFLIHGTNKPWGIGRRVSSGCIRMYPENIRSLFSAVPVETKVSVVDQPIKLAWLEDGFYIEAHPSRAQSDNIEMNGEISDALLDKEIPDDLKAFIEKAAGNKKDALDWKAIAEVIKERRGYPIKILGQDT